MLKELKSVISHLLARMDNIWRADFDGGQRTPLKLEGGVKREKPKVGRLQEPPYQWYLNPLHLPFQTWTCIK